VFSRPFQRYITSPQIPKISAGKTKEKCNHLVTARHASQKNCNEKMTTILSTSALRESQASAYYWQCLLVMIGWLIL
jgi:hypothetical protein